MDTILLIARIVFGGMFFYNGVNHFVKFGMMTQYAKMKGVPFPAVAQGMTGLMLLGGGLSIACGVYPLIGIAMLVAFLVPASFVMHNFWKLDNPRLRMADRSSFLKNMALLGATLMFLALPLPWPLSLAP